MKTLIKLSNLANQISGKTISHASLSPLRWENEVGLCECILHFTDGGAVALNSCGTEDELDYFENEDFFTPKEVNWLIYRENIHDFVVEGVVVSPYFFSFGLLVNEHRIICLDFTFGQSGAYLALSVKNYHEIFDDSCVLFT